MRSGTSARTTAGLSRPPGPLGHGQATLLPHARTHARTHTELSGVPLSVSRQLCCPQSPLSLKPASVRSLSSQPSPESFHPVQQCYTCWAVPQCQSHAYHCSVSVLRTYSGGAAPLDLTLPPDPPAPATWTSGNDFQFILSLHPHSHPAVDLCSDDRDKRITSTYLYAHLANQHRFIPASDSLRFIGQSAASLVVGPKERRFLVFHDPISSWFATETRRSLPVVTLANQPIGV